MVTYFQSNLGVFRYFGGQTVTIWGVKAMKKSEREELGIPAAAAAALMGYNFVGTRNNSEQLKWIDE